MRRFWLVVIPLLIYCVAGIGFGCDQLFAKEEPRPDLWTPLDPPPGTEGKIQCWFWSGSYSTGYPNNSQGPVCVRVK